MEQFLHQKQMQHRLETIHCPKKVPFCHFPDLQILTDFQFFSLWTISKTQLLIIPPHLNCVATLPCGTNFKKSLKSLIHLPKNYILRQFFISISI